VQPDIDLQLNKPEIFMDVDRNRAADMGVSVDAVARTVETMLGGVSSRATSATPTSTT
jgi:multidrug efflux pump